MTTISENEFEGICRGIVDDRELIIKHNPLGSDEEILLWMLMSVLHSYLSLSEKETPCFPGKPDQKVYRDAISFILKDKKSNPFDESNYLKLFES